MSSTRRPLAGQTVLVTRPSERATTLRAALEAAGAATIAVPTVRFVPPADEARLARAARSLADYDWIAFTSATAVERFADAVAVAGSGDALAGCRAAAIGPATAEALRSAGGPEPLIPASFRGEGLADAILAATPAADLAGLRVLILRAETARAVLPERLMSAGARVDAIAAYDTTVDRASRDRLLEVVESGMVDWLTFTAGSTVRGFVELVGPQTGGASVAAISPITAAAITGAGLPVHAVAETHTSAGLVQAIGAAITEAIG